MAAKKRTTVHNLRSVLPALSDPLYIGRGSIWGNPFTIGQHGDRNTVIARYRKHLWNSKPLMAQLPTLRGKQLLCFCSPQACHGHVLVKALEWLDSLPAKEKPLAVAVSKTAAEIDAQRAKVRAARKIAPSADQAEDLLIAAGLVS